MQSLNVLRHIRFLFPESKPRVFEFGPGSGVLGAYLLAEGYPYAATDISQAFYILQSRFWQSLSKGNLGEGVTESNVGDLLKNISPNKAVHVPWWHLVQMGVQSAPSFDVVTCNHALCEMNIFSLRFSLILARAMLAANPGERKAFVFQGWGHSGTKERADVTEFFYSIGFVLVHHDIQIAVFAPANAACANGYLPLPRHETHWGPIAFHNQENILSNAIIKGRIDLQDDQVIGTAHINTLLTAVLGTDDHRTPDERFMESIGQFEIVGSPTP